MKIGFWIPIFSGIPDSLSCIADSKAYDSGFHKQNFPGFQIPDHSIPWGKSLAAKKIPMLLFIISVFNGFFNRTQKNSPL